MFWRQSRYSRLQTCLGCFFGKQVLYRENIMIRLFPAFKKAPGQVLGTGKTCFRPKAGFRNLLSSFPEPAFAKQFFRHMPKQVFRNLLLPKAGFQSRGFPGFKIPAFANMEPQSMFWCSKQGK